jgi:hypothetical protein
MDELVIQFYKILPILYEFYGIDTKKGRGGIASLHISIILIVTVLVVDYH